MNRKFKDIIKSQWLIYLLVIIASFVVSFLSLNFAATPKGEHAFSLFLASYSNNNTKLQDYMNENKPSYVDKISVNSFRNDDENLPIYLSSVGFKHSDLIIIPESRIKTEDVATYCAKIDETIIEKYQFSNFYYVKESPYGVKLYDLDNQIDELITFGNGQAEAENYYMFFRKNSYHIGKMNNTEFETAFIFAQKFIKYGKE